MPGGVGYGFYFNSNFVNDFTTGTSITYDIICPTTPGGNVSTFLYLTSTNRAAKGVEALISYKGQDELSFKVFDWARIGTEPWVVSMTYTNSFPTNA